MGIHARDYKEMHFETCQTSLHIYQQQLWSAYSFALQMHGKNKYGCRWREEDPKVVKTLHNFDVPRSYWSMRIATECSTILGASICS